MGTAQHLDTDLHQLTSAARHDDRAWHQLVLRLTPVVNGALDHLQVGSHQRESVSRTAWRALARRLELAQSPPDVADWLRDRVAIEWHRLQAAPRARVLQHVLPHGRHGLPERRLGTDRRACSRPGTDRRRAPAGHWSPDALAAQLRR